MDVEIFDFGKKKLRFLKYPDTCWPVWHKNKGEKKKNVTLFSSMTDRSLFWCFFLPRGRRISGRPFSRQEVLGWQDATTGNTFAFERGES